MSLWEKALGQTQDSLEGLYVPGSPQEELESVAKERDVWVSLLDLFPVPYPQIKERKWMDGTSYMNMDINHFVELS